LVERNEVPALDSVWISSTGQVLKLTVRGFGASDRAVAANTSSNKTIDRRFIVSLLGLG
jgi:hypothetical protein